MNPDLVYLEVQLKNMSKDILQEFYLVILIYGKLKISLRFKVLLGGIIGCGSSSTFISNPYQIKSRIYTMNKFLPLARVTQI